MNSYLNRALAVTLLLILGMILSSCTASEQPQNANTRAQSNQNANTNAAASGSQPKVNTSAPEGWLDEAKGEFKTGGTITVTGWAIDADDGAPVNRVDVLLDNNVVAQATLGKDRPDVVKAMNHPDWLRAGWEATVSLATVSPGRHKLSAVAYDSTGVKSPLNGAIDREVTAK